jgi:hypothetical protein
MTDLYKELYDESAQQAATTAGELAGMAFAAQELLRVIELGRLDGVQGKNRIEMLQETLREYYQGRGKASVFARPYAKLEFGSDFEAGIERGMKEAV